MSVGSIFEFTSWNIRRSNMQSHFAKFVIVYVLLGFRDKAECFTFHHREDTNVCVSPGCRNAADSLKWNMDTNINPCNDFYKYACGGYIAKTVIPNDKKSILPMETIAENLKQTVKEMVQKPKDKSEPECYGKVKDIYTACMNTGTIDAVGGKPLEDLLTKLGGWPVVLGDKWREAEFSLVHTLHKFREEGVSVDYFFRLLIFINPDNPTARLIALGQPKLGMPDREYLLKGFNDETVQLYYKLMVKIAVRLGAKRKDAEDQLKEMLEFEIKLADVSLTKEQLRNYMATRLTTTVNGLSNINSEIPWLEYFNKILLDKVEPDETVIVFAQEYHKKALAHISSIPKRTVANYLYWRMIFDVIENLDTHFRLTKMEYISKLTGQTEETARWLHCMNVISSAMPLAVGSMYARNHFKVDAKNAANDMFTGIRGEFKKILTEVDWMSPEIKDKAHEKVDVMTPYIGYPDELLDDNLLNDIYSKISVTSDDHFGNQLALLKYESNEEYSELRKIRTIADWKTYGEAAMVDAFYNPLENSMFFPAGILQDMYYDKDRPQYLNYGGIGFVIGHEITHGFDDMGRKFYKDGSFKNWWDNSTIDTFTQRVKCIIDQYSSYTLPEIGLQVNGENTQGESVADNGGLKAAYRAYQKWVNQNGVEPTLPGLELTQQQLFWLNAANMWCSKETPSALTKQVLTDPHPPSSVRINALMSNFAQFSKDFNCPENSPMNPSKKCIVW